MSAAKEGSGGRDERSKGSSERNGCSEVSFTV